KHAAAARKAWKKARRKQKGKPAASAARELRPTTKAGRPARAQPKAAARKRRRPAPRPAAKVRKRAARRTRSPVKATLPTRAARRPVRQARPAAPPPKRAIGRRARDHRDAGGHQRTGRAAGCADRPGSLTTATEATNTNKYQESHRSCTIGTNRTPGNARTARRPRPPAPG